MKPNKIHVEPPPADEANKATDPKKTPGKKEPVTIHVDPSQVNEKLNVPDSKDRQGKTGGEITDGEDG
jgi:hypothetical protein